MLKGLIAVVALASLVLTGCTGLAFTGDRLIGSGHMADRSFSFDGFSGIDAGTAFSVKLFPGDRYLVEVTTDDNLLDYVRVTKVGETLHIGFDAALTKSFTSHRAEARITLPVLKSMRLGGASQATIGAGFVQTDTFDATLSGASTLNGYVQATTIRLSGSGASTFMLNGKGTSLALDLSGASRANLSGMTLDRANAVLNGASSATVAAAESLDYNLSGASHLQYGGSPALGLAQITGGSSATRQ